MSSLRLAALIALLALGALLPCPAFAHVVSDRELRVLRQFPHGFFAGERRAWNPDTTGVARSNLGTWRSVIYQRPAVHLLLDAAARADSVQAETAWKSLDALFARQLANGSFAHAAGRDESIEDALCVGGVCRAFIAVMNSGLAERFRWRYTLMKPKLQRAVEFLEARGDSVLAAHDRDAGGLLVFAAAFLLADGTYHDERYGRHGQAALARALALQEPGGAFPAAGRADVARHALGLESLQSVAVYFPSPTLDRAAASAAAWLGAWPRRTRPQNARSSATWDWLAPHEVEFILEYSRIRPPAPLGAPAAD